MYRDRDSLYTVMEYIPGVSLGMAQLRCIFDQMRALPSPGFYGSVNRGSVPHRYFFSREKDPTVTGPFQTEEEFGKAIALRSKAMWSETNRHSFLSDYLTSHLPSALHKYAYIFPLLQWIDDWPAYVEKILDPLPLEGAMMQIVFSDLEF
ncbi:hypothetical protein BDW72DRAFT_207202 [Aspergillus terricola var. indicus]